MLTSMLPLAFASSTSRSAGIIASMKPIPAQTFVMGDQSGSGRTDAIPAHPVTLDAFYMSPCLVTVQDYCNFLNESGWVEVKESCVVYKESRDALMELWLGPITQENGRFVPRPGTANRPMFYVFWKGAALYCNYLSEKEGLEPCYQLANLADMLKGDILAKVEWPCDMSANGYHLPTEAQWECAARGGLQGKKYPWGDKMIEPKLANYNNSVGHMTDVGSYPPNPYGLYDMAGNVMQWCNDWYDYGYYSNCESGIRNPVGPVKLFQGSLPNRLSRDELRLRHPGLWIDNCASGGRMIDLETTMRSIPLWQSDSQVDGGAGTTAQLQNAGLNLYIPMHCGGNVGNESSYIFRSALMSGNPMGDVPPNEQGRATVETYHLVRPYFEGDYYPLFEHTTDESVWWGYQLDLPEESRGMVLAFRREHNPQAKNSLFLYAIDKKADYEVTIKDAGTTTRMSGMRLRSIIVEIPEAPGSRMLFYKKMR